MIIKHYTNQLVNPKIFKMLFQELPAEENNFMFTVYLEKNKFFSYIESILVYTENRYDTQWVVFVAVEPPLFAHAQLSFTTAYQQIRYT